MHAVALFINNICAQLIQMVNSARNQLFVARNRCCRDNNCITGHNIHLFVVIHRHASKRAHGLTLTTGSNNYDLIGSIVMCLINIDNFALGSLEIAQLLGNIYNIYHAATNNCHLAIVF